MILTPRDIAAFQALANYYVLTREQLQRLVFTDDTSGRVTRRRLQMLHAEQYINRHTLYPYLASSGSPVAVYYPSKKGCEFLAAHTGDERLLLTCVLPPKPNNLQHWIEISDAHITFSNAVKLQPRVQITDWLNEWDIANKDESAPEKRFRLYSLLEYSPRLVAAPDAGFVLEVGGVRKAFYLEFDRATVSVSQFGASRPKGYATMALRRGEDRHFANLTIHPFSILLITPSETRRDNLRRDLAKQPGSHLWKVVSSREFNADSALTKAIYYPCGEGDATPLVKPEAVATEGVS